MLLRHKHAPTTQDEQIFAGPLLLETAFRKLLPGQVRGHVGCRHGTRERHLCRFKLRLFDLQITSVSARCGREGALQRQRLWVIRALTIDMLSF